MNIPRFRYIEGTLYIDKETYNRDVMQVKEYKEDEIDRLNNIIDELEKHIGQEWYCFDNESIEFKVARDILDKLKELKENK